MPARARHPGLASAARESRALKAPPENVAALVADVLGREPKGWSPVEGGHTHAGAWLVEAGERLFVKTAAEPASLRWFANELRVFENVSGSFMPHAIGWRLENDLGVLVLEDLSEALWPPPFPSDARPLFDALDAIAAVPPPDGLIDDPTDDLDRRRWREVARDPEPFLALGVCSRSWLDDALPTLIDAEERAVLDGDELVHNDVWHGNLCFAGERAVLVDWALARRGNRWFDVIAAIVSVRTHRAAAPVIDVPGGAELATLVAGHFAVEAPAPLADWIRPDSAIRDGQLQALSVAWPFAAELLGLQPPSG